MYQDRVTITSDIFTGGEVLIQGSKNSALALLLSACLTDDTITLKNIPEIEDTQATLKLMEELRISWKESKEGIQLITKNLTVPNHILHHSDAIRPSYYLLGSLLHRGQKIHMKFPGGDKIGKRPLDIHFKGLKAMGADIQIDKDGYTAHAPSGLKGIQFYFDRKTCGATINLILAAVLAEGKTSLYNAALDPEVVDLVQLLVKMGAKIKGAGTNVITIEGVSSLTGASHTVIPDRLIAGYHMIMAVIADSPTQILHVIPKHLEAITRKITEVGATVYTEGDTVTVEPAQSLKPTVIYADMYPAFPTDLQQPMTVLLSLCQGQSVVVDQVWKQRFALCHELNRMGANIQTSEHGLAVINGPTKYHSNTVYANDIRAGLSLIFAGILAEGTTTICNAKQIHRGYTHVASTMAKLGCCIQPSPSITELPKSNNPVPYPVTQLL